MEKEQSSQVTKDEAKALIDHHQESIVEGLKSMQISAWNRDKWYETHARITHHLVRIDNCFLRISEIDEEAKEPTHA